MFVVTKAEMKAIEDKVMNNYHIPSLILMENAGTACVTALENIYGDLSDKNITIVCGPGNNGGDGLVMARKLHHMGCHVVVFKLTGANKPTEEHQTNDRIVRHLPLRLFELKTEQSLKIFRANLKHADLIIDAIYGIGLSRHVDERTCAYIEAMNEAAADVVSIDVPSGLDADSGDVLGQAVLAQHTLTIAYAKRGFYLRESAELHVGRCHVLDIGFPLQSVEQAGAECKLLTADTPKIVWSPKQPYAYKTQFGQVGIVAGSLGMAGAASLAAGAASRSGAGIVRLLSDKSIYQVLASAHPEVMVYPVEWPNFKKLDWLMEQSSVLLLGPGMGVNDIKRDVVAYLLKNFTKSIVLDADALTLLGQLGLHVLKESKAKIVLTPHVGEMARLIGKDASDIAKHRWETATQFAQEHDVTLVLKGRHTLVAQKDEKTAINGFDSSALATAGSGDVLSGVLAAALSISENPYASACAAVSLHGQLGCLVAEEKGTMAPIAGDLMGVIGDVLKKFT